MQTELGKFKIFFPSKERLTEVAENKSILK
jgi:hypothetical protein